MNVNKLFSSAFNGLRSKYQTALNSKVTTTTINNNNPYSTITNETGSKTINSLVNNYYSYYPKMIKGSTTPYFSGSSNTFSNIGPYKNLNVNTLRYLHNGSSNEGGMFFAKKAVASEEQWVYNRDRELLKIIKKKLAAKDAVATSANITNTSMKKLSFNPAFNKKSIRFQMKQSPSSRFDTTGNKSIIANEAELLRKSSTSFYSNPAINSRKIKLNSTTNTSRRVRKSNKTSSLSQDQERLERLKRNFSQRKKF